MAGWGAYGSLADRDRRQGIETVRHVTDES